MMTALWVIAAGSGAVVLAGLVQSFLQRDRRDKLSSTWMDEHHGGFHR